MMSAFANNASESKPLVPPGGMVPPMALLPKGAYTAPPKERFGEPLKWLPVAYIVVMLAYLYYVYVFHHCLPRMQYWETQSDLIDPVEQSRGRTECIIFHIFYVLLLLCYLRSILEHPGKIPEGDPQWDYLSTKPAAGSASAEAISEVHEAKKSGDRRHCKWCGKYKPDRCHHCRVCRICILKMDHHCPWIYNCVGFANYKYFLLLLIYCSICSNMMLWTMTGTVRTTLEEKGASMGKMFIVLFGETLAGFMALLTTLFLGFHLWLASKALTTIEFCEKQLPKKGAKEQTEKGKSLYDMGMYQNMCNTFGDNPIMWFLPANGPTGDGLKYATWLSPSEGETGASPTVATLPSKGPSGPSGPSGLGGANDEERPYEKTGRSGPSTVSAPFWSIGQ